LGKTQPPKAVFPMIHPKDEGLAFPRTIKEKGGPKPLRSKPKKYQKASVSEEHLQNFAEEMCVRSNLDYDHVPQVVYEWLSSKSEYCPPEVLPYLRSHFYGRPDMTIEKKVEGTDLTLSLLMEIKTDSDQSKLRTTQKNFLRGKNFVVPRSKEEIKEVIKEFEDFEIEID